MSDMDRRKFLIGAAAAAVAGPAVVSDGAALTSMAHPMNYVIADWDQFDELVIEEVTERFAMSFTDWRVVFGISETT